MLSREWMGCNHSNGHLSVQTRIFNVGSIDWDLAGLLISLWHQMGKGSVFRDCKILLFIVQQLKHTYNSVININDKIIFKYSPDYEVLHLFWMTSIMPNCIPCNFRAKPAWGLILIASSSHTRAVLSFEIASRLSLSFAGCRAKRKSWKRNWRDCRWDRRRRLLYPVQHP